MDYILLETREGYLEYPITKEWKLPLPQRPFRWEEWKDKSAAERKCFYLTGEERVFQRKERITIAEKYADICIKGFPYGIVIEQDALHISCISPCTKDAAERETPMMPVYINGKRIFMDGDNSGLGDTAIPDEVTAALEEGATVSIKEGATVSIKEGDRILAGFCLFTFFEEELVIRGNWEEMSIVLLENPPRGKTFEGFPRYKRSPRIIKKIAEEQIDINSPPGKTQMKKSSLVQVIVSPLVMVGITIAMGIIMKRGLYVLVSAATTVMTTIFSIVKYLEERKECRLKDEKREELYEAYLLDIRRRLSKMQKEEEEAYRYHYPSVKEIERMIETYSSRIYERSSHDDDFLSISLGTYRDKASYTIKDCYDELSLEKDELEVETREIKELFSDIAEKPAIVNLKKAHLGLVGEKEMLHGQLKLIIAQLTFLHSYHDLEIITIYDAGYHKDFSYLKWYPHCKIRHLNVSGCIYLEKARDQVLGSLTQILKERKQKRDEEKKEGQFLPHFLFIIDEPKLILDHSIMEYLERDGKELGFSILYTTHLQANLPETVGTIFRVENSRIGRLVLNEKSVCSTNVLLNKSFYADSLHNNRSCSSQDSFERMARDLGVLIHEKGIVSKIPESITFFEMYGIEHPQELSVRERWQKNESHKTLAVPLGVRAENDYVNLNLHEKAHGPHGLVAGTTGSGKSEIVQSYILSLAVNYHPYEVGFLLIDYKGGGMAGLFKNLPHLMGTITNLDGSESMRAMASIKSELARRQRIFGQNDVNHINGYNKLFKLGKVTEPIPHLFLISDEFAELKKEQPEFMKELVSAARIGRSLGIHLILATQKPSGVVDDQIWTNSKFKLALKVQNEADSREILKTPDAASITQPGRAYLQVGNNEVYELFQSAWSGAAYSQEENSDQVDNRVYLVNELGQGELINADLSSRSESKGLVRTQLDAVVDYIQELFNEEGSMPVKRPWMPPLPDSLQSPYLLPELMRDTNDLTEMDLSVPIGIADIPEKQKQTEYIIHFAEEGNLAIFGSAGFGKSVLLTTILLTLAVKNTPRLFCSYIIDFGNSGLLPLKKLPHVIDYLGYDDIDKLGKLIKILDKECRRRRQLFARESAVSLSMYNNIADEKLPSTFIVIDNYDMVKEASPELEAFLGALTRDGAGLGIYVLIAASKSGAVRFNVMNNFRNKIALYIFDKSESNSLVGRSDYPLSEKKGRALVKLENVNQMQVYTAAESETQIAYVEGIKHLVSSLSDAYTGERYLPIPMLPETLNLPAFKEFLEAERTGAAGIKDQKKYIPFALETSTVKIQYLNLANTKQILIGGVQSGKTNLLKVILEMCDDEIPIYLCTSKEEELYEYRGKDNLTYVAGVSAVADLLRFLENMIEERMAALEEERILNPNITARTYYEKQDPILVLIEDFDTFIEYIKETKNTTAEKTIARAAGAGVAFLACTLSSKMKGIDPITKFMKEAIHGIVLGNPSEQVQFGLGRVRSGQAEAGAGYVYEKGRVIAVQIPKVEAEE